MKVKDTSEGTLIEFGNTIHPRVKVLFFFEVFAALSGVFLFLFLSDLSLHESRDGTIPALFTLLFSVAMLIYAYRFLNRIFNKESLLITKEMFSIINHSPFGKKKRDYQVSKISRLNYIGRQKYTDHPLKGQTFDYLGFQTKQEVINAVNDEGNMKFFYEGAIIYFGKGIYSWQAEELEKTLLKVTENNLQFDDLTEDFLNEVHDIDDEGKFIQS